jgi:hypothetical protein
VARPFGPLIARRKPAWLQKRRRCTRRPPGQIAGRPVFCLRGIPTDSGLVSNLRRRLM